VYSIGVLKEWQRHKNAWKGNLQANPSEVALNIPFDVEYRDSRTERQHEFHVCCYVNMHKWCTHKVTGNWACKHGEIAKLEHISYCCK
jgi:hypothetical protein